MRLLKEGEEALGGYFPRLGESETLFQVNLQDLLQGLQEPYPRLGRSSPPDSPETPLTSLNWTWRDPGGSPEAGRRVERGSDKA